MRILRSVQNLQRHMTEERLTLAELKAKSPKDLLAMAEELEIENASTMRPAII